MKNYLALAVLGLGLVGCTSSERAEVRQESREAADATRQGAAEATNNAAAKRREYSEKTQARLDKIDREMEEERLKAKGRKMTAKQKREYDERMAELDTAKKETKEKWNEFTKATDENWEQFKDGLDRAGDKLETSWNRFVADVKN